MKLAGTASIVNFMPNPPAPARLPAIPPAAATTGPLAVVLAYDGLATFEFGIACEVFGLSRPELGPGWYRYAVAAVDPGPMRAGGGLTVTADSGLEVLADADLIVVPGWRAPAAPVPTALCEALVAAHRRGATIASLCSGAFVLAAAGLLDGHRATTHWRYFDALRARYPGITLAPDVLYVDEGTILTAAGSGAGIDLCLHIVRRQFGPDAANSVARRMVMPPHRDGGQAQFVLRPVPKPREGARLGALIDWMRANLADDMPIAILADRAGMSLRTFQRRFEETVGLAPGAWLVRERVDRARELLEKGDASLDDIAASVGFGSVATLRHHFRAKIGLSPASYRNRFAARAAPATAGLPPRVAASPRATQRSRLAEY